MAPWVIPAILTAAAAGKGYLSYKSGLRDASNARRSAAATQSYYNQLAANLAAQPIMPFIPPYIADHSYKISAALEEHMGNMALARAENQAEQLEADAIKQQALAQRRAIQERDVGRGMVSDAVAAVTAGGGVTADVSEILADMSATAEYNALSRLWEGDDAAQKLQYDADMAVYDGRVQQTASIWNANVITAQGVHANEMGALANMAAQAEYNQYLADRDMQIRNLRLEGQYAYETGRAEAKRLKSRAKWGAVGSLIDVGIAASGFIGAFPKKTPYTNPARPHTGMPVPKYGGFKTTAFTPSPHRGMAVPKYGTLGGMKTSNFNITRNVAPGPNTVVNPLTSSFSGARGSNIVDMPRGRSYRGAGMWGSVQKYKQGGGFR